MNSEFIDQPISGQYAEKHFGRITPSCLWVKFVDKDELEWVGSFEQGWVERAKFIIELNNADMAFVVAYGKSFLIDINAREQINQKEIPDTRSAITDEEEKNIYYSNGFDLNRMDLEGNDTILFNRYYFDDIKLVEIKANKLYATYFYYQSGNEPFHFEIDVLTKEVKDSFRIPEKKAYTYENPKPSWLTKLTKWLTN